MQEIVVLTEIVTALQKYKRRRIRSVSDDDEPVQERDEESKEGLEHVLFDDGDQMSEAPRKPARHLDDDLAQEIEDEEEDESGKSPDIFLHVTVHFDSNSRLKSTL